MDEMKFDMEAGSVFGALYAASLMSLPINIVGVIAAAENMPSGRAHKPEMWSPACLAKPLRY